MHKKPQLLYFNWNACCLLTYSNPLSSQPFTRVPLSLKNIEIIRVKNGDAPKAKASNTPGNFICWSWPKAKIEIATPYTPSDFRWSWQSVSKIGCIANWSSREQGCSLFSFQKGGGGIVKKLFLVHLGLYIIILQDWQKITYLHSKDRVKSALGNTLILRHSRLLVATFFLCKSDLDCLRISLPWYSLGYIL